MTKAFASLQLPTNSADFRQTIVAHPRETTTLARKLLGIRDISFTDIITNLELQKKIAEALKGKEVDSQSRDVFDEVFQESHRYLNTIHNIRDEKELYDLLLTTSDVTEILQIMRQITGDQVPTTFDEQKKFNSKMHAVIKKIPRHSPARKMAEDEWDAIITEDVALSWIEPYSHGEQKAIDAVMDLRLGSAAKKAIISALQ